MEIEKKFKVSEMPVNLDSYKKKEIEQGYLNRKPTVRIRKSNDDYILTYKGRPAKAKDSDTTICNNEIEAELNEEAYYHLREKIDGHPITKTRYIIPIGTCEENCPGVGESERSETLKIELDIFHGVLEGLVFAEVEFPSVDAAEKFRKPSWFGEDVSSDSRYRNGYLSQCDSLEEM